MDTTGVCIFGGFISANRTIKMYSNILDKIPPYIAAIVPHHVRNLAANLSKLGEFCGLSFGEPLITRVTTQNGDYYTQIEDHVSPTNPVKFWYDDETDYFPQFAKHITERILRQVSDHEKYPAKEYLGIYGHIIRGVNRIGMSTRTQHASHIMTNRAGLFVLSHHPDLSTLEYRGVDECTPNDIVTSNFGSQSPLCGVKVIFNQYMQNEYPVFVMMLNRSPTWAATLNIHKPLDQIDGKWYTEYSLDFPAFCRRYALNMLTMTEC